MKLLGGKTLEKRVKREKEKKEKKDSHNWKKRINVYMRFLWAAGQAEFLFSVSYTTDNITSLGATRDHREAPFYSVQVLLTFLTYLIFHHTLQTHLSIPSLSWKRQKGNAAQLCFILKTLDVSFLFLPFHSLPNHVLSYSSSVLTCQSSRYVVIVCRVAALPARKWTGSEFTISKNSVSVVVFELISGFSCRLNGFCSFLNWKLRKIHFSWMDSLARVPQVQSPA